MSSLVDLRTKTREEYIKIDPSGKIWSSSTLDAYINRAYFQVQVDWQHRRPEQYADYSLNTTSGTGEYSLPSDFIKLDVVAYNYQSLVPTDKSALKKTLNWPFTSGTPYAYYTRGSNLWLYPVPNTTGVVDLEYFKKLPKITSDQDCLLPEDFDDAICLYAAYLAFNSVSKVDKASVMRADYNEAMSTLLNSYIYNDRNIVASYQYGGYTPSDLSSANLR